MNPFPISLPFSFPKGASVRVFVFPEKFYNQIPGRRLIELYGAGKSKFNDNNPRINEYIHWKIEDNLFSYNKILKGKTETILTLSKPIDDVIIIALFFPSTKLPESIQIGKQMYLFRDLIHIIEDILEKKIICRYSNRVIKTKINTTIEVTCQPVEKGLIIFGKKGYSYLLRRN